MRPFLKIISAPIDASFLARKDVLPCLDDQTHFHPEYELIYVVKGYGMRYVGESMHSFKEGDLAFLGPNLPHLWRNDRTFLDDPSKKAEVIIIQFKENFLSEGFFDKPEMKQIKQLFQMAKCGLQISGDTNERVAEKMKRILDADGCTTILILLRILNILANSSDLSFLSSPAFHKGFSNCDSERMNNVYKYMTEHFKNDISLEEIASVACLSTGAFCRYFKKRTKKSFSQFLNEIKVAHACELLLNIDLSVTAIGFNCGFNSLTNFNRQFKQVMQLTPGEYRKRTINLLKKDKLKRFANTFC